MAQLYAPIVLQVYGRFGVIPETFMILTLLNHYWSIGECKISIQSIKKQKVSLPPSGNSHYQAKDLYLLALSDVSLFILGLFSKIFKVVSEFSIIFSG